jgi:propanol-preferring alcohol dehydrogenase
MRAFQLVARQRPPEFREVPVPESGSGQILVKIGGAGACQSDLHLMESLAPPKPTKLPFSLGHENAAGSRNSAPAYWLYTWRVVLVHGP